MILLMRFNKLYSVWPFLYGLWQLWGLISMQTRVPEGHKPCKWCNNSSYISLLWFIMVELSDKRLVGENKFYLTMFFVYREVVFFSKVLNVIYSESK